MERKSTGRAEHEQRLEDMLNTDKKIERKIQAVQDRSRDWKIC